MECTRGRDLCCPRGRSLWSGMILVSDAISAAGLEHGLHTIGAETIEIKQNVAYIAGTETLCGSIAMLDQCARNMLATVPECSAVDAINCATLHPARALGIEGRKGALNFGGDADFVILNDQLDVLATFVGGHCGHRSERHTFAF